MLPLICSCKWGVDKPIFPVRCVEGWKLSPVSRVACYQEILRPKRMEMLGRGGSIIWCQSGRDSRGRFQNSWQRMVNVYGKREKYTIKVETMVYAESSKDE